MRQLERNAGALADIEAAVAKHLAARGVESGVTRLLIGPNGAIVDRRLAPRDPTPFAAMKAQRLQHLLPAAVWDTVSGQLQEAILRAQVRTTEPFQLPSVHGHLTASCLLEPLSNGLVLFSCEWHHAPAPAEATGTEEG